MAWWGTVIGGALGWMFGGPLGAILGAALGGNFDRGISLGDHIDRNSLFSPGEQERVQAAFFTATFSVMGHIAKVDGHVSKQEIGAVENLMAQMQLNAQQRKAAIKLFEQGKVDDFPLHDILLQFKKECLRRRNLIQMFIEIQIGTALADGKVDPKEKQLLYIIGQTLGFSTHEIDHLFTLASGSRATASNSLSVTQAYEILGVNKNTSMTEVKKAYRRLMSQHHPDKLVSRGLPDEMIELATKKTQEIRKAYELVKEQSHAR